MAEYTFETTLHMGPIEYPTCPYCGYPRGWGHAEECSNPDRTDNKGSTEQNKTHEKQL
jgi:hypothetical protein